MKKTIPLSRLAIALIILCSINIGICLVVVEQKYHSGESYLLMAFLGISMLGIIRVIIRGSKRAAVNERV